MLFPFRCDLEEAWRSLALHLREQIAKPEPGESAVAAKGDCLPSRVCQLRAEDVGCGGRHRSPREGPEEPTVCPASDVPRQPHVGALTCGSCGGYPSAALVRLFSERIAFLPK